MKQFIRIGVDLAKNYFQIHALPSEGAPAIKRKATRRKMREFFSQIAPCCVGMEACAALLGARTQGNRTRSAPDAAGLHQALR